jgi:hypothetical protein
VSCQSRRAELFGRGYLPRTRTDSTAAKPKTKTLGSAVQLLREMVSFNSVDDDALRDGKLVIAGLRSALYWGLSKLLHAASNQPGKEDVEVLAGSDRLLRLHAGAVGGREKRMMRGSKLGRESNTRVCTGQNARSLAQHPSGTTGKTSSLHVADPDMDFFSPVNVRAVRDYRKDTD